MLASEKREAQVRCQSYNSISLTLFYDICREKGLPDTEATAKELIEQCIMVAKVVDDALYKELEPFL